MVENPKLGSIKSAFNHFGVFKRDLELQYLWIYETLELRALTVLSTITLPYIPRCMRYTVGNLVFFLRLLFQVWVRELKELNFQINDSLFKVKSYFYILKARLKAFFCI